MKKQWNLLKHFDIPEANLKGWFRRVRQLYNGNPFHNALHGLDVMEMSYQMLSEYDLGNCLFNEAECYSYLLGAFGHDVNHPGVNNMYLINTKEPLAAMYNDVSVLENMHTAICFNVMNEPGCN